MRPHLALTLGDPAGIGPEVVLKALADPVVQNWQVTVVGHRRHLMQTFTQIQDRRGCSGIQSLLHPDALSFLEVGETDGSDSISLGQATATSGAASFASLETAIAHTLDGQFDAIVTGPIAKSAWRAAGHNYPGQTELLAERAGRDTFGMMFVAHSPYTGWTLRTLLATAHIPLRAVPDTLTPELLTSKLALLLASLREDFGLDRPWLAIAGLNPHSGEQGQLGNEEEQWLIPWLRDQQTRYPGLQLEGPVPPDTLWVKAGQAWYGGNPEAQTPDAYLALYHDQGLIPVKLLGFDRAVNTTLGLPFVRTSPDHGTAFDIAGKGVADPSSLLAALELAATMANQRDLRLNLLQADESRIVEKPPT